jgi:hypothetical protein
MTEQTIKIRKITVYGETFVVNENFLKEIGEIFSLMKGMKFNSYVAPEKGQDQVDIFEANCGWFYRAIDHTYVMIRFNINPRLRRGSYGISFEVAAYDDPKGEKLGSLPPKFGYGILMGETSESYDNWNNRVRRKIGISLKEEISDGEIEPSERAMRVFKTEYFSFKDKS